MDTLEERARVTALQHATEHLSKVIDVQGYPTSLPETDLDKQLEAAERYRKFLMGEA